ncbi:MAG: hypothetical protein M3246_00055 [Actinomycetota bacterium]|nr:hypothetical protein [Actinomycetota bacterium]
MEATPPTGRPGRAKRLLSWIVGGPPRSSETTRFAVTLLGVAFAVYALTWDEEPLLIRIFALCAGTGVALWGLGGLLYRWRETFADLLRVVGVLTINLGLILFIAGLWWVGHWGRFWSALVGYAVVFVIVAISILRARTGRDASSSERRGSRD